MTRKKFVLIFGFLSLGLLILPNISSAQILPACAVTDGDCGFCDILDTGVKIFRWLLGILGGTALLLFVWHGFSWLTSMGNAEKIEAAKKALIHTTLGIIIVLASWTLVNIVLILLLTPPGEQANNKAIQVIFPGPNNTKLWYQYCTDKTAASVCANKGTGSPCGEGRFCLLRCEEWGASGCTKETFNCHNTNYNMGDPSFRDACDYLNQSSLQFQGYNCIADSNNCVAGRSLGRDYCKDSSLTCCLESD